MANHPSAEKRHRQSEKRRVRNAARQSQIRTLERKLKAAVTNKDLAVARDVLKHAISGIMRARSKGVLHKRTVARKVSRLSRAVHKAASHKA